MKDSKANLFPWRSRRFRKKDSVICELFCDQGASGGVKRHSSMTSATIGCSRILREQAHFHSRPRKRYRITVGILVCLLAAVGSYAYVGMRSLKREPSSVQGQILKTEPIRAASGEGFLDVHKLIDLVLGYLPLAGKPESSSLLQGETLSEQDLFIKEEIIALLKEFGAEEYSIPPEFLAGVNRFIRQYQERDHEHMARALAKGRTDLDRMREILRHHNVPQDLAYMVLVESGFLTSSESQEGAAGLWQFTEDTARGYGMEVSETVDERLDLSKSTVAASRFLRDLILDFGTGSSVMLAIAAYNSGPERVRRAVRSVKDPIKQRSFWYLYRTEALPIETREYVPKVIAATIIGRNPKRFGF